MKVSISEANSLPAGKNAFDICVAYKPNRKKSNISMKLPPVTRRTVANLEELAGEACAAAVPFCAVEGAGFISLSPVACVSAEGRPGFPTAA